MDGSITDVLSAAREQKLRVDEQKRWAGLRLTRVAWHPTFRLCHRLRGRRAVKFRVELSKIALAACLIFASAFTGCASLTPGTVPEFTEKSRCEGNGNVWYAKLGICSRV